MSQDSQSRDPSQLPRPGEMLEDRYRLEKRYASGGMGVIMTAEQVRTEREVAVKILHPHIAAQEDFAARFKREVQVATLFDHPNIVRVYDVGESDDGLLYLVMEFLEGEELKETIERNAPMPTGRVVDIACQFLDGLAEAHSQDVVHRDLKPANIFVGQDRRGNDEVKVLDFGVAKLVNEQQTEITETGNVTGTPSYMAPEVLVDSEQSNRKPVDTYASGLILLEMLIGQKVFSADNMGQTLLKQLKKAVRIPEVIAETPLGAVIRKATAKHPDNRYPDADAMLVHLEEVRGEIPDDLRVDPDSVPEPAPDTSPSLLQQMDEQDTDANMEMLRMLEQRRGPAGESGSDKVAVQGDGASSSWGRIFTVAMSVLGIAGFAVLAWNFYGRGPKSTSADDGKQGAAEPLDESEKSSRENELALRVTSEPTGASVWRRNRMLGKTNVRLEFDRDELPQTLRLEAEGHRARTLEVTPESDGPLSVALRPKRDTGDPDAGTPSETTSGASSSEPEGVADGREPTRPAGEEASEDKRADETGEVAEAETASDESPPAAQTGAEEGTSGAESGEEPSSESSSVEDDVVSKYLGGGEDEETVESDDESSSEGETSDDESFDQLVEDQL